MPTEIDDVSRRPLDLKVLTRDDKHFIRLSDAATVRSKYPIVTDVFSSGQRSFIRVIPLTTRPCKISAG
jgi:hypothetical protein